MSNPIRVCIACTASDDHPRHVIDIGSGDTVAFHMDCHVLTNGCEVCKAQIAGAKGAKGEALREHLLKTGPGRNRPGWTPPGEEDDDEDAPGGRKVKAS